MAARVYPIAQARAERLKRARKEQEREQIFERAARVIEATKPKRREVFRLTDLTPDDCRRMTRLGLFREVSPGVFEVTHLGRVLVER